MQFIAITYNENGTIVEAANEAANSQYANRPVPAGYHAESIGIRENGKYLVVTTINGITDLVWTYVTKAAAAKRHNSLIVSGHAVQTIEIAGA